MNDSKQIKYNSDTILQENLIFKGSIEVVGSLQVYSLKSKGEVFISGNLQSTQGSITSNGSLIVDNNVLCYNTFKSRGNCKINGSIESKIVDIDDSLSSKSITAEEISLKGDITVKGDLTSVNSITIFIIKFRTNDISGVISAPLVQIKYRSIYTNLYELPRKLYKILGKKKVSKREITFDNLSIKTDILRISSFFHPEEVNFNFSESCQINAKKIEFVRDNPKPKRERKLFQIDREDKKL